VQLVVVELDDLVELLCSFLGQSRQRSCVALRNLCADFAPRTFGVLLDPRSNGRSWRYLFTQALHRWVEGSELLLNERQATLALVAAGREPCPDENADETGHGRHDKRDGWRDERCIDLHGNLKRRRLRQLNVRGEAGPIGKRRACEVEHVPWRLAGPVLCCWASARPRG